MKRSDALGALAAVAVPFVVARAADADPAPAMANGAVTDVIAKEVAAFNAHDAATITKLHAPDAALTLLPAGAVIAKGSDAILAFFTKDFATNPTSKLTLVQQFVLKNVVVNHYTTATGSALMAIYEVKDGLVANEWLVLG